MKSYKALVIFYSCWVLLLTKDLLDTIITVSHNCCFMSVIIASDVPKQLVLWLGIILIQNHVVKSLLDKGEKPFCSLMRNTKLALTLKTSIIFQYHGPVEKCCSERYYVLIKLIRWIRTNDTITDWYIPTTIFFEHHSGWSKTHQQF